MTLQKQLDYVHPEVLVDTQWAEDHLNDPKVRVAEVDSSQYNKAWSSFLTVQQQFLHKQ